MFKMKLFECDLICTGPIKLFTELSALYKQYFFFVVLFQGLPGVPGVSGLPGRQGPRGEPGFYGTKVQTTKYIQLSSILQLVNQLRAISRSNKIIVHLRLLIT